MRKTSRNSIIRLFDYSIIRRTRQGSALLIVLGLVSFMVISAVAFSAYMRQSRLPSSYLLRLSSSRNLVKAGLAESLDEIDRAIGNNPHPGVPFGGTSVDSSGNVVMGRNQWRDRVFYGTNQSVAVETTVSTLSLEALAYVPAPLINDVRYHSRRSPAAVWHTLGFDSGRFAFTAIDVSDYFDVNRLMAEPANPYGNGGRTSAEDARISLAYLLENGGHTGWRTRPDAWDDFMDAYLDDNPQSGSKVPLVSWADLNLAIWDQKPQGVISPWCRFVENGTEFVQDSADERQALSNMVFMTDSWYPQPKSQGQNVRRANLSDRNQQPFAGLGIERDGSYANRGFDDILRGVNNSSQFNWGNDLMKWTDLISPPELAQLCDYLDVDSVPISLALPTAERTPMITGIMPIGAIRVDVRESGTYEKSADPNTKYKVTTYEMKLSGDLNLMVGAVYPFKHAREADALSGYKMEAIATIAFVPAGSNPEDMLRDNAAAFPGVVHLNDTWNNAVSAWRLSFYDGESKNSVACKKTATQDVPVPTAVKDLDSAMIDDIRLSFGSLDDIKFVGPLPASDRYNGDTCSFRTCRRQVKDPTTGQWIDDTTFVDDTPFADRVGFLPVEANLSRAMAPTAGSYHPSIQFWVRLFKGNDTVDFVPACHLDDRNRSQFLSGAAGSSQSPMLRFRDNSGNATIALSANELKLAGAGGQMVISPGGYIADDPRFNYAPENFTKIAAGGQVGEEWKKRAQTRSEARDGDIFMETSDAGYLQSKYELMYLSRLSNFNPSEDWGCLDGNGYNGQAGTYPADPAMWRTYSQYRTDYDGDDFSDLQIVPGTGGTRVCPYTPDTAVMMGAFANTPCSWWAAATNAAASASKKQAMLSDIDTALRYTFSDRSDDETTRTRWSSLERLARNMITRFRLSTSVDGWKRIFDQLDWNGAFLDDLEADNSSLVLDSVERKFLYGYWRECFDARQQLFLVFVRAEPMMMGGGANGAMPPMLGARAVALVWRDPTATRDNAPHRMRVLFYRQFD